MPQNLLYHMDRVSVWKENISTGKCICKRIRHANTHVIRTSGYERCKEVVVAIMPLSNSIVFWSAASVLFALLATLLSACLYLVFIRRKYAHLPSPVMSRCVVFYN